MTSGGSFIGGYSTTWLQLGRHRTCLIVFTVTAVWDAETVSVVCPGLGKASDWRFLLNATGKMSLGPPSSTVLVYFSLEILALLT